MNGYDLIASAEDAISLSEAGRAAKKRAARGERLLADMERVIP